MVEDDEPAPSAPPKDGTAVALSRRWTRIADAYIELQVTFLEAEVVWGDLLTGPSEEIGSCLRELRTKTDLLITYEQYPPAAEERKNLPAIRAVVFRTSGDDEFGRRVLAAVNEFRELLRGHVAR